MPTLEEREAETPEELAQRLDAKKTELGISHLVDLAGQHI